MAKTYISLESFVNNYVKNLELKNRPTDYATYLRKSGIDYDAEAGVKANKVLTEGAMALGDYGKGAEALGGAGLVDDGYAAFLKSKAARETESALGAIEKERLEKRSGARRGYLSYLDSYNKSQDSLRRNVTTALTKQRIIDPERVYQYAIEAGLTKSGAEATVGAVYSSIKGEIKAEIIDKVFNKEYTPEMAAAYAKSIGLYDEDVDEIVLAAEEFKKKYATYSSDYIKYLESLGNKNTIGH